MYQTEQNHEMVKINLVSCIRSIENVCILEHGTRKSCQLKYRYGFEK